MMLVGFPIRQFEMCVKTEVSTAHVMKKIVENGKTVMKRVSVEKGGQTKAISEKCTWIDENAVDQYTKQGYTFTGKKRMSYCPPEWIADKTGGGILILDDWNRANLNFIQACMELIDRQTYISWKLPKDWHIILTANPDDGNYLVNAIDVAQRTRFISVNMKWDQECWAEWAEKEGIDSRCINFVLMHPEIVKGAVNPRSLTTFFNSITSIPKFEDALPLIQMVGEGSVGAEAATLFTTFINNRLDKLITPKEMLTQPEDDTVKAAMLNAINENGDYRADVACILTTRLINFTLLYAEKNPIEQKHLDRIQMFIEDDDIFTNDLRYQLVKKIVNGNKRKFQKLLHLPTVQAIVTK